MKFDLQPRLEGEKLLVRPIRDEDWSGMFSAAADPELWAQHPSHDRYKADVFRGFFDDALASGSAFSVVDRDTQNIIGSSRYNGIDEDQSEIEIGWTFLTRAYWGGDTNAELKALMLEHAFRFVDTVVFLIGESNMRSRRAVEKIGGCLRDGTVTRPHSGGGQKHVVYQIGKAAWYEQSPRS